MKLPIFLLIISFSNCYGQTKDKIALETGWYYISKTENEFKRQLDQSDEVYFINPVKIVGLENLQEFMRIDSSIINDKKILELILQLDESGAKKWEAATKNALDFKLAFILNDKLIYAPTIVSEISNGRFSILRDVYTYRDLELIMEEIKSEMNSSYEK